MGDLPNFIDNNWNKGLTVPFEMLDEKYAHTGIPSDEMQQRWKTKLRNT